MLYGPVREGSSAKLFRSLDTTNGMFHLDKPKL